MALPVSWRLPEEPETKISKPVVKSLLRLFHSVRLRDVGVELLFGVNGRESGQSLAAVDHGQRQHLLTDQRLAVLDEMLFSLSFVADYRAENYGGKLRLTVLTCGEGKLPPLDAELYVRPVSPADTSLYPGKRTLR